MNTTFKYIIFSISILLNFNLFSQLAQTKRIEMELGEQYQGQEVYLFGEKGLILLSRDNEKSLEETVLKFEIFNTDLKKTYEKEVAFGYEKGNSGTFLDANSFWIYNYEVKSGNFKLLQYTIDNNSVTHHNGVIESRMNVSEVIIINNKVYFSGVREKLPFLMIYDLLTKNVNDVALDGFSKKSSITTKIVPNPTQVHVQFSNCESKKSCDYLLLPFDENGKQISKIILLEDYGENKLSSFSTSSLSNNHFIATGTYSDDSYATAQGVYITSFDELNKDFIKFYNFLDFKNFLSYLSEKKQDKILNKKDRKEGKGKELKLDYLMAIHNVIEKNEEYLFVGEAYYPTYRTEYYTTYVNGVATRTSRRVFDGYQYTHAAVAMFDKEGKMKWSNSFEMWLNYKPFFEKQFITTSVEGDKVSLMFATGGQLKSISFVNGEVQDKRDIEYIDTGSEEDKVKWTSAADVEYWYKNSYISTGFQKIKNTSDDSKNKRRRVFFINKVEY